MVRIYHLLDDNSFGCEFKNRNPDGNYHPAIQVNSPRDLYVLTTKRPNPFVRSKEGRLPDEVDHPVQLTKPSYLRPESVRVSSHPDFRRTVNLNLDHVKNRIASVYLLSRDYRDFYNAHEQSRGKYVIFQGGVSLSAPSGDRAMFYTEGNPNSLDAEDDDNLYFSSRGHEEEFVRAVAQILACWSKKCVHLGDQRIEPDFIYYLDFREGEAIEQKLVFVASKRIFQTSSWRHAFFWLVVFNDNLISGVHVRDGDEWDQVQGVSPRRKVVIGGSLEWAQNQVHRRIFQKVFGCLGI